MTPHPIDTDTTSRALRAIQGGAWGPNDMDLLNRAVPALCDALEAAEHRATRAETQSETRRASILYWQEQAGAMRGSAEAMARDAEKAQERALEAEERIQAVREVLSKWMTYCQHEQTMRVLEEVRQALKGDT